MTAGTMSGDGNEPVLSLNGLSAGEKDLLTKVRHYIHQREPLQTTRGLIVLQHETMLFRPGIWSNRRARYYDRMEPAGDHQDTTCYRDIFHIIELDPRRFKRARNSVQPTFVLAPQSGWSLHRLGQLAQDFTPTITETLWAISSSAEPRSYFFRTRLPRSYHKAAISTRWPLPNFDLDFLVSEDGPRALYPRQLAIWLGDMGEQIQLHQIANTIQRLGSTGR